MKIKIIAWKKLKQLALDQNMSLQAEIDAILGSFIECMEETQEDRRK